MKRALSLLLVLLLCLTFTACGEDDKQTAQQTTPSPNAPAEDNGAALVGTWTHTLGSYTFNADGTGMVETEAITWSVSGDTLTLTNTAINQTMAMQYRIEGDTLIFVNGNGSTMEFTKKEEGDTTDPNEGKSVDFSLVGTWVYGDEKITFYEDLTGFLDTTPFTWTAFDGFVIMINGNTQREFTMAYQVDGNQLTLAQMDGSYAVYTKQ